MSGKTTRQYESPSVTEYGSVEDLTEQTNKAELGQDSDIQSINLRGSVNFK